MKNGRISLSKPILFLVVCGTLAIGFVAGTRGDQLYSSVASLFGMKTDSSRLDLASIEETYQKLKANYDGDIDVQKLVYGANRGMVEAVGDPYTVYMDPTEAEKFNKDLEGDVGAGIGAEIGVRSDRATILRVLPDHPAEKAGVQRGDVIEYVNGESALKWDSDTAAKAIRGEKGTTVKIIVSRNGEAKEFAITRDTINNPSVESRVEDGVGILKISRFDAETGVLARKAAESLKAQNVKGIVVDVRSDGGGYLDAAKDVAGLWLNNTVVATQRNGNVVISTEKTGHSAIVGDIKTVVLVDGGTASASEILAAALRDSGKATIIGEKTFGKGSVQQMITLGGGSQLKVTVARWYTPRGVNVSEKGLTPEKTVKLTQADLDADRDPQLDAAKQKLAR